jgi:hypothetical protein
MIPPETNYYQLAAATWAISELFGVPGITSTMMVPTLP